MRRTGSVVLLAILAALPPGGALGAGDAAAAGVTAEVSAVKIGLDDTLVYTLTFSNIQDPAQPDMTYLDDFKVLQTSRSSEFQFRDGASTAAIRFTYYLMPTRTGRLLLPAVSYSHQGREYGTQAFAIEVVKGSLAAGGAQRPGAPSLFDDDFFSSPFRNRQPQKVDAYLRAVLSKPSCFKGEQLLFRVLLYTRNRIEAVNMLSSASFAGFWQEWFPVPQSISPSSENVNGVIYQVYEVRKAALFAGESGSLTIPPLQFELQLADPAAGFFGTQALRRSTQAIPVAVSDPGADAAGLPVGQFTFSLDCPRREADVNEIVTLRMRISGSGNTKAIMPPALPGNKAAMVYPAKITRETAFADDSLAGTLIAEIPVAFQQKGDITFPALEFRYFDPERRVVVALRSAPLRIRVSGEKSPSGLSRTLPGSTILQKGEDIDFIKGSPLRGLVRPIHRRSWFPLLLAGLFLANLLVLLKVTAWDRGIAPSAGMRNRRLLARALKGLDGVRRTEEIAPVLESYFCAKSGLGPAEICDRRIAEALAAGGLARADIDRFLFIKGQSELARFSPAKKSALELKKDLQALRGLFREIDRKMK
ncbi:MAG: BatD family protein [Acidobacteria bacterium]|jgi:hypothetical protein|nr:BatD family protein [Acidobacteriota bacterium]